MTYLVFSQEPAALPDVERLRGHAERFFGCKLERLDAGPTWIRVRLTNRYMKTAATPTTSTKSPTLAAVVHWPMLVRAGLPGGRVPN